MSNHVPMVGSGHELPPPDYIASAPEDDPTLQVPVIIQFDDWRTGSAGGLDQDTDDHLPAPPAELLEEDEPFPEPPPDYEENVADEMKYPGLIPPHKLPNPVLDSKERRQIHKDIKFINKHGINPLDNKNELQKELEKRKLEKQRREFAEQQKKNRNSLEQKLDQQKERLEQKEREESIAEEENTNQTELAKIHNKIRAKANE